MKICVSSFIVVKHRRRWTFRVPFSSVSFHFSLLHASRPWTPQGDKFDGLRRRRKVIAHDARLNIARASIVPPSPHSDPDLSPSPSTDPSNHPYLVLSNSPNLLIARTLTYTFTHFKTHARAYTPHAHVYISSTVSKIKIDGDRTMSSSEKKEKKK